MSQLKRDLLAVESGSEEAAIIDEELTLLAKVQRQLAKDHLAALPAGEYDRELIALRDQIAEAHEEDLAPLIAEMYRMQALGAHNGKGRSLPVDVNSPYFGHLRLNDGKRVRNVLVGSRGFVRTGCEVAIVDWRNAPVSRIYYCYDEGDDYEEYFGNRPVAGIVEARRTVGIIDGELRRITWSSGAVAKDARGQWVSIPAQKRPTLQGGAGVAARPPAAHHPPLNFKARRLGVVGDESLREDKHLKEITALIDPEQFQAITRPDSGTVILKGGAGSGKTTVALHRAAYLHFQDPQTFSPKKMVVVVKSEPLTEYISRVLPSLDVAGTPVVTLRDWMYRTRKKVMPEIKKKMANDVPAAVSKLKKHPRILALLEDGVAREADGIGEALRLAADEDAQAAVAQKWSQLRRLALLPRVREMSRWVESAASTRAGIKPKARSELQGILRRARSTGGDILGAWADLLTDKHLVSEALAQDSRADSATDAEINELVRWVGIQDDDPDLGESDDEDTAGETEKIGGHLQGPHQAFMGIDGEGLEDETRGRLDEHDDALLLKLMQLKCGGLAIPGSNRSVTFEHIVVDEAQDLSPTDIAVLRGALTKSGSMTLAGDTAQKLIFDNSFDNWETMLKDVGISGVKIDQLKISYRSTHEIVHFARQVLGPLKDPEEPVVPRSGAPVEQFRFASTGEAIAFLGESLRSLVAREKKANVAVVSRYKTIADMYCEGLKKSEIPALRRVYGKEFSFTPGVDVVDVAQIKGLEYDYVILVEVNKDTYPDTRESRHLLHIAATRAVHQLWVTSVNEPSPLLPPEASY